MPEQHEFFIHVSDAEKNLVMTRTERIRSKALSPCEMAAEDVDYEMAKGKDPHVLRICGMTQEGLEHFVQRYGRTYRYISLFKCQLISDLSPLADMPALERVDIYWNIRADRLWDMSANAKLAELNFDTCRKLTYTPTLQGTAPALRRVGFEGDMDTPYPMADMECFVDCPALESISLHNIRLEDRSMDWLSRAAALKEYHFDPGMYTTEEIAWIAAHYPHVTGRCIGAYSKGVLTDVRINGWRKPAFDLPKGQKRMDRYIAEFDALVERYRTEQQIDHTHESEETV